MSEEKVWRYYWNDVEISKEEHDKKCEEHLQWVKEYERKQVEKEKTEEPVKRSRKKI